METTSQPQSKRRPLEIMSGKGEIHSLVEVNVDGTAFSRETGRATTGAQKQEKGYST